jgi:hypothetical protein
MHTGPTLTDTVKAWLVSVDMGYGHHRAIHPLRSIAEDEMISVNRYTTLSAAERKLWDRMLRIYEGFSRARGIPIVGKPLFSVLDSMLRIPSFYPIRDLSHSTYQVDLLASSINKGLCKGMLQKISTKNLPLLTSFYAPAIAADLTGYEPVYCILCDADLNRVWVAREPWESRIHYFAPCGKAAQRLKAYGVPEERIFITGFPLPIELLGGPDLDVLKRDLRERLHYLDPKGRFHANHGRSVDHFLGTSPPTGKGNRVLTISYSVGGAGAQVGMGIRLARGLRTLIREGQIRLNLIAGIRENVRDEFLEARQTIAPSSDGIRVVHSPTLDGYFETFNDTMHETDILWTKPSELSFFSGLGIPLVVTPTIGSHEKFNRWWLYEIQAGIRQEDLDFVDQWLVKWLESGRLADAAWSGFLKARKLGTFKILEVLRTGTMKRSDSPLLR